MSKNKRVEQRSYGTPLLIIIIIILIAILVFRLIPETPPIPIKYITDTVYVHKPYEVPKPYEVIVPPKIVKIYDTVKIKEPDWVIVDSLRFSITQDSILIDGFKKELALHKDYLRFYPTNPKLISLSLNKNVLSITGLSIDGNIYDNQYPINTEQYRYLWENNALTSDELPKVTLKNPVKYYMGGGLNLWSRDPYFTLRAEKSFGRVNVYSSAYLALTNKKISTLNFGFEYSLRK